MADSLTAVGSVPFFPLEPNWATLPRSSVRMGRKIHRHEGTIDLIEFITDDAPIVLEMGFTVVEKSEEYDLLDFFYSRLGRHEKFWITWPREQFILNRDHNTSEATLDCELNSANLQYQGYERIEILMNNGDKVVRQITSIAADETEVELSLDTVLDRDITTDGYIKISRLLLVRFDIDELSMVAETDYVGDFVIRFYELVNEYGDV